MADSRQLRLAVRDVAVEPVAAVDPHLLDQRDQGSALLGQRVLNPRRDLGEGLALDDALLLQRPEAKRQRPRADAPE